MGRGEATVGDDWLELGWQVFKKFDNGRRTKKSRFFPFGSQAAACERVMTNVCGSVLVVCVITMY